MKDNGHRWHSLSLSAEQKTDQRDEFTRLALSLFDYCAKQDWAGFDPYDALNSALLERIPLLKRKLPQLALTQSMKRLPVNLRPLLGVPKAHNAKGIALFLMAVLKLSKLGMAREELPGMLAEILIALRSPSPFSCWGYSFPWQTRTLLVPKHSPNLVCTIFGANALLDAYEANRDPRYLSISVSAAEYLLQKLYWTGNDAQAGFAYPLPSMRTQVHNANFLGAAFLCRLSRLSGEKKFLAPALAAARSSAGNQRDDGSWYYGESSHQRWIDNFHTGYNLCALRSIARDARTDEFDAQILRGFEFYKKRFFREDGAPRYFHDRTYPIDIHCVAQSIITLLAFKDLDRESADLAASVFLWAKNHMWDERHGYFYYQVHPFYTNKIPYMRWSQAWMLLALATLLEDRKDAYPADTGNEDGSGRRRSVTLAEAAGETTPVPSYVLITPARNEAQFIEQTIQSVTAQSVLPLKWVIVSDGSTDGTDEIVKKYAARHPWIELVRMPEREERHFAGKVRAFNAGRERVENLQYDVIGSLDADITFGKDYFSFLLAKFAADSRLGVAGTPFQEGGQQYDYRFTSIEHVSGACQLFRRECFESIGGYKPIKGGGIDWVAVTTARMKGWKTRTFPERVCIHHRKIGTARNGSASAKFKVGVQDYYLGGHPLWEIFRCLYQMKKKPYILGGIFIYFGYLSAAMRRVEKPIPEELIQFRRTEQMRRLKKIFGNVLIGR